VAALRPPSRYASTRQGEAVKDTHNTHRLTLLIWVKTDEHRAQDFYHSRTALAKAAEILNTAFICRR